VILVLRNIGKTPTTPTIPTTPIDQTESLVKSITTIKEGTPKSMDWSHANNLVVFGKLGSDTFYDVYIMNPDGSNENCLTCGNPDIPKHNGNPAWHPSGKWIVFTAEFKDDPAEFKSVAIPGSGTNSNLWVMSDDGKSFYQLTDYPFVRPYKAVIHPQFSHGGSKVFWAERVRRGTSFSGGWVLKIADFVVDETPHLENIKIHDLGGNNVFYESHAFSKDDKKILFSGNLISGQTPVGLDIYELNLETKKLNRLTSSLNDWDEHAHYSPSSKKIAWMSSTGFDIRWEDPPDNNWQAHLKTELWIMDTDGSNQQRLTYFNEPDHAHYFGSPRVVVSDSSWSPDGKSIIALLAYEKSLGKLRSKLVMIELE